MAGVVKLAYPFTFDSIKDLKLGQVVRLSGCVFTARDRAHRYLHGGGVSPVDFTDGALYHCGPVVMLREGKWSVRAAGPTTSMREESFMASIIERHHIRVIIGKGGMGEATRQACKKCGCVYLQAVGGAGSISAAWIREVQDVHFLNEFGAAEAIWTFVVEDFEAVVSMNARGWSLHDQVKRSSRKALDDVLNLNLSMTDPE